MAEPLETTTTGRYVQKLCYAARMSRSFSLPARSYDYDALRDGLEAAIGGPDSLLEQRYYFAALSIAISPVGPTVFNTRANSTMIRANSRAIAPLLRSIQQSIANAGG